MNKLSNIQKAVFLVFFTLIALISMQVNFSALVGANNQFFTFFQFFGPIAGGFLAMWGVATILGAQLLNFVLASKELSIINLFRLAPMLFAAYYFSRNGIRGFADKFGIVVPLLAIAVFWLNPAGRAAWYYALFWTIPIIVKFLPDNLFLRSLGATFTAHAVGGTFWVLLVPMTAAQWTALVPVTAYERLLFALGISASYLFFTNVISALGKLSNLDISSFINIEKRYVFALLKAE